MRSRFAAGVLALATAFSPPASRMGLEVEWAELVHADDDFGLAWFRCHLAVGDGIEVFDPALLAS
ncbi:hypothetical protein AQI95_41985 [Streptomyces yokosukanensis]|uniref:Uncharacterized protein n=1 Tax=Streptomyces yokosukanensis TaxID=67386 RepID=A0A101NQI1_9ACTN|nr:hypothetical protein AQI95_41985 [Streptomyces yokosukanensis]